MSSKKQTSPETNKAFAATTPPPCLPTIPFLPVRYAIIPKLEDDKETHAYQHANLEKDFPPLRRSKYTLRKVRAGFIYIRDDAGFVHLWRTDGNGYFTEMKYVHREDYRERSRKEMARDHISLPLIASNGKPIKQVEIAYVQNLLSKSIVEKIKKNPKFRARLMQPLDLTELDQETTAASAQKHVLPMAEARKLVEEYKAQAMDFSWSAYAETAPSNPPAMTVADKARLPAMMALFDAQGITLDLGCIVNLYQHQFIDLKNRAETFKKEHQSPANRNLPAPMLLDTRSLKSNSVDFLRKKMVADLIEAVLDIHFPHDKKNLDQYIKLSRETIRKSYGHSRVVDVGDEEARFYTLSNPHLNKKGAFVSEHIDVNKLRAFHKEWDQEMRRVGWLYSEIRDAKQDRVLWLKSGEAQYKTNPKSLAALWSYYDRYHAGTASDLEMAISTALAGIGIPLPDKAHMDPEWQLLDTWITEHNSPVYKALAAYKPFYDALMKKQDSSADILGGLGAMGEEFHKIFPATIGTAVIVQNVQTYTFRKLQGQTRWNRSHEILRNVRDSLEKVDLKKLLQAIEVRYKLVSESIEELVISKRIRIFTDGISNLDSKLEVDGTRTTTIKKTTTVAKNTPIIKADLLRAIGASGISTGVAWLHSLNLLGAIEQLKKEGNTSNKLNMASALFGAMGAFSELTVKGWELQERIKTGVFTTGTDANKSFIRFLASKGWQRVTGYGGAALEFASQFSSGLDSLNKGHKKAMYWYFGSAGSLATGGSLITLALTSNSIPVIGWVMAVGLLAVGIGIYANEQAEEASKHVLMKRWLTSCDFGTDPKKLRLETILKEYYMARFTPEQRRADWDDRIVGNNILNIPRYGDIVEFDILLPGYVEGVSEYDHNMRQYDEDDIGTEEAAQSATVLSNDHPAIYKKMTNEGLMLTVKKIVHTDADSARFEINYTPNPAMTAYGESITQVFFIDD